MAPARSPIRGSRRADPKAVVTMSMSPQAISSLHCEGRAHPGGPGHGVDEVHRRLGEGGPQQGPDRQHPRETARRSAR